MKKKLILSILLLAISGAGLFLYANRQARDRTASSLEEARLRLANIAGCATDEDYYELLGKRLFAETFGRRTGSAELQEILSKRLKGYPDGLINLFLFDGDGALCWANASATQGLQAAFSQVRKPWTSIQDYSGCDADEDGSLLQNFSWLFLTQRPRIFERFFHPTRQGGAIWDFQPHLGKDQVAGAFFLVIRQSLPPDFLLRHQIEDLGGEGRPVGFLNRSSPGQSLLIPGMTLPVLQARGDQFFQQASDHMALFDGILVMKPCRANFLLYSLVPVSGLSFPREGIPLVLLVFGGMILFWRHATLETISLPMLLATLLGVSAGIPFLLSLTFWTQLEESRKQAITVQKQKKLEDHLISLDRSFPELLRRREALYKNWVARFTEALASEPLRDLSAKISGKDEFFYDFPQESAMARLIGESEDWELQGLLDTIYLVGSSGHLFRDNSDCFIEIRRLAQLPPKERNHILESLYDRESKISWHEIGFALRAPPEGYSREQIIGHKMYNAGKAGLLAMQLGREVIRQFNLWKGFIHEGDGSGENTSSLLLSNILDAQGGNLIQQLVSATGEFSSFRQEEISVTVYTDIMKDRRGQGQFATLMFHNVSTLAHGFWDMIASAAIPDLPDEHLLTVTSALRSFNYPEPFAHRTYQPFIKRIVPPQTSWNGEARINGEDVLISVLSCRQIQNYFLIGTVPVRVVRDEIQGLRLRLWGVGLAMAIIIFALLWRTRAGIVRPMSVLMEGLVAMEGRRFDHRVELATGDEWEILGQTFNQTLAGMEELEVARIVQRRLLPESAVETEQFRFYGQNIMTSAVGGDYYDARICPDGSLAFILGDVSGHGVSAALVVAMAKAAFGAFVRAGVTSPATLLQNLNSHLFPAVRKSKIMTCIAGFARPNGEIILSNAGQCFPFIYGGEGLPRQLGDMASLPLAVREKSRYVDLVMKLEGRERLIFYTDGIPEAANHRGEFLGYEGLTTLIGNSWNPGAKEMIANMHSRLHEFTDPSPWADDVTIALLSRREKGLSGMGEEVPRT